MAARTVTLPVVEAHLAAVSERLAFPPDIEAIYQDQMRSYRLDRLRQGILRAVIAYNVFLLIDFLLLPRTALIAAFLHFGAVTPIIFLVGWFYPRVQSQSVREIAAAIIPLLMVGQIMLIYALNRGEAADQYQYLAIMIVIYTNINQRLEFRIALATTVVLAAAYLAVLLPGHSSSIVKVMGTVLVGLAGYLSLMANRRMERDVRQIFLTRLRDQLRREGAEAIARRDALTGLPNRRELDEKVPALWAADGGAPLAVVMIDIDHFKKFNDRYGHLAGDTCLKRISGAIATELRHLDDLAVRYGGEEFLVLLSQADIGEAIRIAERVRRQIEGLAIPHEDLGPRGVVTASLGVIAGRTSQHSFAELVASADAALYAAKRSGRNQVWPPIQSERTVAPLHKTAVG